MPDLSRLVLEGLAPRPGDPARVVAVLHRGGPRLVTTLAAAGHRLVVVGDGFPALYRAYRNLAGGGRASLMIESSFEHLPLRAGGLDALVLARGMPAGLDAADQLVAFRRVLRSGGMLFWPHPIREAIGGSVNALLRPLRRGTAPARLRHEICELTLAAGFTEIRQERVTNMGGSWMLTTAQAGSRPWESRPATRRAPPPPPPRSAMV